MEKRKVTSGKFNKWLENKNILKIVSLVFAIILWFYVATTQDPIRTDHVDDVEVNCSLSQSQIDSGLTLISKSNDSVSFKATGKRSYVTGVRGSYSARLDLEKITEPGKYNIAPTISKPEGVDIRDVTPSVIEVYVDKIVASTIPVEIETTGELPEGIIISEIIAETDNVVVQLPSFELEHIYSAGVVVDLSKINASTDITCQVYLYDQDKKRVENKKVTLDKKEIVVSVTVGHSKKVNIAPKISGGEKYAKGYTATVTPKTVEIYGNEALMAEISQINTKQIVLNQQVKNGQEFEVELIIPEGLKLKDGEDSKVKVTFNK